MKLRSISFLISFIVVSISGYTQISTTHTINYEYADLSKTSCNVFSSVTAQSNYDHSTSFGTPTFVDDAIQLKSQQYSSTEYKATQYAIKFPFKKGRKYNIKVYSKSVRPSLNVEFPTINVKLSTDNGGTNTSTSCPGGPQKKSSNTHLTYANSIDGESFTWSSALYDGIIDNDFDYLLVLATPPTIGNSTSGVFSTYVRKIQIIEEIQAIDPPTTDFEAKFYKNVVNNKIYVGMKGKYRPFTDNTILSDCFENSTYININADPSSDLIGEDLAPIQQYAWNDELWDLSAFFIFDESSNKNYFVEARRSGTAAANDLSKIEFHCTDITDSDKFSLYKFDPNPPSYVVWDYTISSGLKIEFDNQFHKYGSGFESSIIYIKSSDLP